MGHREHTAPAGPFLLPLNIAVMPRPFVYGHRNNAMQFGPRVLTVARRDELEVKGWVYAGGRLVAAISHWVVGGSTAKVSFEVIESTVDAFWAGQREVSHIALIFRNRVELFFCEPGAFLSDRSATLQLRDAVIFEGTSCPATRLPSSL